jgi:hypothetical protein
MTHRTAPLTLLVLLGTVVGSAQVCELEAGTIDAQRRPARW